MKRALFVATFLISFTPSAFAAATRQGRSRRRTKGRSRAPPSPGSTLRSIGPALTSGRIGDLAVDPTDSKVWCVAVASGGVWKTTNAGTTWTPVFDGEGSYSIGCVTIDPKNPNVVWVGTGENNSQRSVALRRRRLSHRSTAASPGRTWGSRSPSTSAGSSSTRATRGVVYVAAQGPLWSRGGDRGLYKSDRRRRDLDAGAHDQRRTPASPTSLLDPRDPDTLYAAAYQRRRHVWTLDRRRPRVGAPQVDRRRQDLAQARRGPARRATSAASASRSRRTNPDVVYAIVEAEADEGGFFRSTDRGESWEKRSGDIRTSGKYYNEIFADPHQVDRVYSMDTFLQVTDDGGKTFRGLGEKSKHVDNHAIWIDPAATPTTTSSAATAASTRASTAAPPGATSTNLPITQFYRVGVDNAQAVLQRLRRHAGQLHARRPVAHRCASRAPANQDWFDHPGRRRLLDRSRSDRPEHRLRRVAARRPRPLRPQERREPRHPAAAGRRASRRCAGTGTRR